MQSFIEYFPEINPPITLTEDLAITFSAQNKPFPAQIIAEIMSQWEKIDEFTELVPCFKLATPGEFFALVYWKGSLMSHEYILITISKDFNLLSKKVIAGTISNGQTVKKSIANIDEQLNINAVVGESKVDEKYNPQKSKAYNFEILPDGFIEASEEHNNLWQ